MGDRAVLWEQFVVVNNMIMCVEGYLATAQVAPVSSLHHGREYVSLYVLWATSKRAVGRYLYFGADSIHLYVPL